MIDWSKIGPDAEAMFEEHRQTMVAHFIRLRLFDADVARASLASYVDAASCPHPAIADDVKASWAKHVASQKTARIDAPEPAGSRSI